MAQSDTQPEPENPAAKAAVDAATILEQTDNPDGSQTLKFADGSLQSYDPETGDKHPAGSWSAEKSPDAELEPTKVNIKFDEEAPTAATEDKPPIEVGAAAPLNLSANSGPPPEADPVGGLLADSGAHSLNEG